MRIIVTYKSEVLGQGIFWEGPSVRINEIRNIPARELAKEVIKDGQPRQVGMWSVKVEDA